MKSIIYALPIVLTGLLASQISSASTPNKLAIAEQYKETAYQLNHLKNRKPQDRCAGDVAVAAAYLSAAELKVRHERYDEALVSVHYGTIELKGIAYTRTYCAYFAPLIKPYIARVIQITSELEVLERMKA